MKNSKWNPKYTDEINKMAEGHTEALLALYADAFNDGMRTGRRNALLSVFIVTAIGAIGLCAAGFTYLEKRKQPQSEEES